MQWKTRPGLEPYQGRARASEEAVHMWMKLRGGVLELRVETGRWERVLVGGRQLYEDSTSSEKVQGVLWGG